MTDVLQDEVLLPCGVKLPNRIAKAPMTEGLADEYNRATEMHCKLYSAWSRGGTGLLITGNVQVDRRYMERPGNVAIDGPQDEEQLSRLRAYAKAATGAGNHCWPQIGHAGRQCDVKICKVGVGPSAVASQNAAGALQPSWPPKELTKAEIKEVVSRFVHAAKVCKEVGFTGVQVHSAHGYLLSSFLSPKANQRIDEYGGSVENRARLLLTVVKEIRGAVGPNFPLSVKLNSADFGKGGFSHEDSMQVAKMLDETGVVDLLEISGGNYETPAILGGAEVMTSTKVREAYFLTYAEGIQKNVKRMVLMLTGGMRSRTVMEKTISDTNIQVIGVGRPLCGMPDATKRIFDRQLDSYPCYENTLQLPGLLQWLYKFQIGRIIRMASIQMWYYKNLILMGQGNEPDATGTAISLLSCFAFVDNWDSRQAKTLRDLDCEGTVLNAPTSRFKIALAIALVALSARKVLQKTLK